MSGRKNEPTHRTPTAGREDRSSQKCEPRLVRGRVHQWQMTGGEHRQQHEERDGSGRADYPLALLAKLLTRRFNLFHGPSHGRSGGFGSAHYLLAGERE